MISKRSILTQFVALLYMFMSMTAMWAQSTGEDAAHYAEAGQRAMASGQFAEARDDFEHLAKLEPSVAEIHATLAAIYFQQGEFELSVHEVHTALKLKPTLPRLDSLLGLSLAELSQFTEALPLLEKGFKQTADVEVRRMCGLQLLRAYTGLGRDSDAVQAALALNKAYPDDAEVMYHTGRIYGNFAYLVMQKLHDKAPGSVWMLQAQADANESEKNYDAAIVALQHILAIEPRRPGIHYRMGRIYLSRYKDTRKPEDRDSARKEFAAELESNPGNGNATYELAQMAADDNDMESARAQFEAVVEHFPTFEQALVGLGGIYLQLQQGTKAVVPLERATKLDAEDEVAWYRLAQAERAAGDRDAAQSAMDTFRKLHAASSEAQKPLAPEAVTPQQLGSDATP
jgi:predicted Zn-dependent protease